MIQRILRSGVAWGTFGMGIRMVSAALLLPLTTRSLDSSTLGMWYVFTTILGISSVIDAGITGLLGRRFARRMDALRKPCLDRPAKSLLGTSQAIFIGLAAATLLILGGAGGWWVWQRSAHLAHAVEIRIAFLMLCPSFVLFTAGNAGRVILFGSNRLNAFHACVALAFTAQLLISGGGLLLGGGLFALVAGNVTFFAAFAAALPVSLKLEPTIRSHLRGRPPIDWRMGQRLFRTSFATFLNTLANFLALYATVLIASKFLPLSETASYGLTLQVLTILAQTSVIWLELKQPVFSKLYREDPSGLHRLFTKRMRISLSIFSIGVLGLIFVGNPLLVLIHAKTHFLHPSLVFLLALFIMLSMHQTSHEWLCLCLGKNPFTKVMLISAMLSLFVAILLCNWYGLPGLIIGTLLPQLLIPQWWIPWRSCRQIGLTSNGYFKLLLGMK